MVLKDKNVVSDLEAALSCCLEPGVDMRHRGRAALDDFLDFCSVDNLHFLCIFLMPAAHAVPHFPGSKLLSLTLARPKDYSSILESVQAPPLRSKVHILA